MRGLDNDPALSGAPRWIEYDVPLGRGNVDAVGHDTRPSKFIREGITYDELSEDEKEEWDEAEWDEEGETPDRVGAEAIAFVPYLARDVYDFAALREIGAVLFAATDGSGSAASA